MLVNIPVEFGVWDFVSDVLMYLMYFVYKWIHIESYMILVESYMILVKSYMILVKITIFQHQKGGTDASEQATNARIVTAQEPRTDAGEQQTRNVTAKKANNASWITIYLNLFIIIALLEKCYEDLNSTMFNWIPFVWYFSRFDMILEQQFI